MLLNLQRYLSKPRRHLTGLLSYLIPIILITCITPFIATATETEKIRQQEKKKLELNINKHQINIQRLDQGLQNQQEGVEQTLQQEKSVLAELEEIDLRLNRTLRKLRELHVRMEDQQQLIYSKKEELEVVRAKRTKVQLHLQKRMAAYYKLGKIDLVNITFSTKTLPELLKFHDSFQNILKYDQNVIGNYRDSIEKLEGVKEALTLEHGLLEEFIYQAGEEKKIIKKTKEEKQHLLARIKNQEHLHVQAIREIKKAQDELTTSLLALKKKDELYDQGFLLNRSEHIPPVEGKIVSLFNEDRVNKFNIKRKTPGISFRAPDGTKIQAIFDGKVIFSGYLRGYGNTVIIDHGYQYYTITSRIERILVVKNNKLKRHDIIGIMGETATLMDDGLYFEIRHKETSLDPLKWLNNELLTFKEDV